MLEGLLLVSCFDGPAAGGCQAETVCLAVLMLMRVVCLTVLMLLVCLQDVPAALNGLLDSLPSKVSIQGLPFDAVFTYALYTLNYVIVKVRPQLLECVLKELTPPRVQG